MSNKLMFPFRNAHCTLREHLVQRGCFLSVILIAKCAKELPANTSRFLLMEVTDTNGRGWNQGTDYGYLEPEAHYSIQILRASAPLLIPSLTHSWSCSGRKVSLSGNIRDPFPLQAGNFLEDRMLCSPVL